jgi:protein TonB
MRVSEILERRDVRLLLPAFAASLAVHVGGVLLALAGLGAAPVAPAGRADEPLAVRIVDVSPAPASVVAVSQPLAPATVPDQAAVTDATKEDSLKEPKTRSTVGRAVGSGIAADARGSVTIVPNQAYARIGEELDKRAHSEFEVEVQKPVRLEKAATPAYPRQALERGIEGSIVAWIVVRRDGEVDEVQVEDDASVFKDAVVAAARESRYSPAENRGHTIPHYIMLEYQFRIRSRNPTVAAAPQ